MNLTTKRRFRRRRYPVNLIKLSDSYDPAEVAKLFGIHRNTVRHWLKEGLVPIDDRRPILVNGAELRAFISGRQKARKQKCAPGEFFCFRCRAPQKPWGGMADFSSLNDKIAKAVAFCSVCETQMHRTIRSADLSKFVAQLNPQTLPSARLTDRPDPNLNCQIEKDKRDVETEPAK
jgi:Helix-turn-helix domain